MRKCFQRNIEASGVIPADQRESWGLARAGRSIRLRNDAILSSKWSKIPLTCFVTGPDVVENRDQRTVHAPEELGARPRTRANPLSADGAFLKMTSSAGRSRRSGRFPARDITVKKTTNVRPFFEMNLNRNRGVSLIHWVPSQRQNTPYRHGKKLDPQAG